jgi:hypothetical protein
MRRRGRRGPATRLVVEPACETGLKGAFFPLEVARSAAAIESAILCQISH